MADLVASEFETEVHQHTVRDLLVTRLETGTFVVAEHQGNGVYKTVAAYPAASRALAVALANDVSPVR